MADTRLRRDNSLCKYTGNEYGSCALHFLLLTSIYKPSSILIPFVLSKILLRQVFIMTNTKLRGDNYVHIQVMDMVLVHSTSSHCHLSTNQVSFQSLLNFPRYDRDKQHLLKMVLVYSTSHHCHLSIYQV